MLLLKTFGISQNQVDQTENKKYSCSKSKLVVHIKLHVKTEVGLSYASLADHKHNSVMFLLSILKIMQSKEYTGL